MLFSVLLEKYCQAGCVVSCPSARRHTFCVGARKDRIPWRAAFPDGVGAGASPGAGADTGKGVSARRGDDAFSSALPG